MPVAVGLISTGSGVNGTFKTFLIKKMDAIDVNNNETYRNILFRRLMTWYLIYTFNTQFQIIKTLYIVLSFHLFAAHIWIVSRHCFPMLTYYFIH